VLDDVSGSINAVTRRTTRLKTSSNSDDASSFYITWEPQSQLNTDCVELGCHGKTKAAVSAGLVNGSAGSRSITMYSGGDFVNSPVAQETGGDVCDGQWRSQTSSTATVIIGNRSEERLVSGLGSRPAEYCSEGSTSVEQCSDHDSSDGLRYQTGSQTNGFKTEANLICLRHEDVDHDLRTSAGVAEHSGGGDDNVSSRQSCEDNGSNGMDNSDVNDSLSSSASVTQLKVCC
jgi:hypothetical protein